MSTNVTEIVQSAEDVVKTIKILSPELLCIVGLLVWGYVLRAIPQLPNKALPIIWILSGPIAYLALVNPDPASVPPNIRNVWVYQTILGLILGAGAWFLHEKFLSHIEDWLFARFPWLERTFGKVKPAVVLKAEEIVKETSLDLTPPKDK